MSLKASFSRMVVVVACFWASSVWAQVGQLPDDPTQEQFTPPSTRTLEMESLIQAARFEEPKFSEAQLREVRALYSYADEAMVVPQKLKDEALAYFHVHQAKFANQKYITIVDFSPHSSLPRMFIIDMQTGAVVSLHVAHGKGSDPDNDGFANKFSNISGSEKSSLGSYMVSETYVGEHGRSIRLDGLSSTNSNVRAREVVVHGAAYVSDSDVTPGRSWGCFALPMSDRDTVVKMLNGGSYMYAGLSK